MSLPISLLIKGSAKGLQHSLGRFKKNRETTKQQKLLVDLLEKELSKRRKHNQDERTRQRQLLIREIKGEYIDPEEYTTENGDNPGLDMEMMKKLRDSTKRTTGDVIKDVIVQPWYGLITSVVKNKRQKKIDKLINAIEWEKKYHDDFFTKTLRI